MQIRCGFMTAVVASSVAVGSLFSNSGGSQALAQWACPSPIVLGLVSGQACVAPEMVFEISC